LQELIIFSVDNFCTIWSHLTSRTNDLTNLCWCCFSNPTHAPVHL